VRGPLSRAAALYVCDAVPAPILNAGFAVLVNTASFAAHCAKGNAPKFSSIGAPSVFISARSIGLRAEAFTVSGFGALALSSGATQKG